MLREYAIVTILIIAACYNVTCRDCKDCKKVSLCKPAMDYVLREKDKLAKRKLQLSYCGLDLSAQERMVCCSDFETSLEDWSEKMDLLPRNCGHTDVINTEQDAKLYEFPWMALISYNISTGLEFDCTGSIINSRYVLTAAHCVRDKNIAGVRVGEFDISNHVDCQHDICEDHIQDIPVEEAIVHEKYYTSILHKLLYVKNDIALLRLAEDIDFKHKNVGPICLPLSPDLREYNLTEQQGVVAGWGGSKTILGKVFVPIKSAETCRQFYNRGTTSIDRTENQICAGAAHHDTCRGDSGAALTLTDTRTLTHSDVDRFIQFGIVSYGPTHCGSRVPGVYTDVRKFVDWILGHIRP